MVVLGVCAIVFAGMEDETPDLVLYRFWSRDFLSCPWMCLPGSSWFLLDVCIRSSPLAVLSSDSQGFHFVLFQPSRAYLGVGCFLSFLLGPLVMVGYDSHHFVPLLRSLCHDPVVSSSFGYHVFSARVFLGEGCLLLILRGQPVEEEFDLQLLDPLHRTAFHQTAFHIPVVLSPCGF